MTWEKQELGSYWKPEAAGEEQIGVIDKIEDNEQFGKQYTIKQAETGDIVTLPSHKVLQNRLVNAIVGSKVKIVYTGEELPKVKGNNPTKMYEVYLDK